jgi:adenylyl-sulfate kinase
VLISPEHLLQSWWFDVTGSSHRASREVICATGIRRNPPVSGPLHAAFEFDREFGTPLYLAYFDDSEPTHITEVIAVDYGSLIDSDLFRCERRAGQGTGSPSVPARREKAADPHTPLSGAGILPGRGTIWLTGCPSAGKTTIAHATERILRQLAVPCCVIDGDELRHGLSSDLDLSEDGRHEQARRATHIAVMLADAGVIPIVALVSPYAEDRRRAREVHAESGIAFHEVWVDTATQVCADRDTKGLYSLVATESRDAAITVPSDGSGLTGVSAPYEPPVEPALRVSGHDQHPREAAEAIVALVLSTSPRSQIRKVVPSAASAIG